MTRPEREAGLEKEPLLLQALRHLETSGNATAGGALLWMILLLLRYLIGLHSYSGAQTPPMFGDYEAQRHWMELTVNLPVSDWYFNTTRNDLLYWGLDYPPLTAYVSFLFGRVAQLVEPEMVQLEASRGYETATSKVFMRCSVLLCDALLLAPAVLLVARALYPQQQQWTRRTALLVLVLAQPSLLLIDHGHFQYNNVCLGLSALGAALILGGHELLGSISFSLALNFKQMALYYAPSFGVYLLARSIHRRNTLLHLVKLAVAVVAVFAALWLPFCAFPFVGESCATSMVQVLRRIFPFGRGLFEDKVANFWCIVDLVAKIRRHVDSTTQMRLCTLMTLTGFAPSVMDLLRRKPTGLRFILSMAISSLSFFLFSFQVHEKTVLLPLLPISFLFAHDALLAGWFSLLSTFSMFFLLKKDGLLIPYVVLQAVFACVGVLPFLSKSAPFTHSSTTTSAPAYEASGAPRTVVRLYVLASITGALLIHLAQIAITPPARYPHIHDYVFAAYSCAHFLVFLGYLTYWQWTAPSDTEKTKTD